MRGFMRDFGAPLVLLALLAVATLANAQPAPFGTLMVREIDASGRVVVSWTQDQAAEVWIDKRRGGQEWLAWWRLGVRAGGAHDVTLPDGPGPHDYASFNVAGIDRYRLRLVARDASGNYVDLAASDWLPAVRVLTAPVVLKDASPAAP